MLIESNGDRDRVGGGGHGGRGRNTALVVVVVAQVSAAECVPCHDYNPRSIVSWFLLPLATAASSNNRERCVTEATIYGCIRSSSRVLCV